MVHVVLRRELYLVAVSALVLGGICVLCVVHEQHRQDGLIVHVSGLLDLGLRSSFPSNEEIRE